MRRWFDLMKFTRRSRSVAWGNFPVLLFVGLLLASVSATSRAQGVLEVIPLRHRTAEQVIPVLRPLLDKDGSITGLQGSLVVRTSPRNLADLRKVLESIDAPPRRLMISVRQDADIDRTRSEVEASVDVTAGRGRVQVPGPPGPAGATAEVRQGDVAARARVYGTQSAQADRNVHQVQVLEGAEAWIQVGQSVPVPTRSVVRSVVGGRVVEQTVVDGAQYRDTLSGFHVRARLAGETVTLEINPQRDTAGSSGPGSVNVQRMSTTVSGRLGEWIELGGVTTGRSFEGTAVLGRTVNAGADQRRVLLRVDEVR